MTWTTPTLVEICIGLEINGYLPAEFWFGANQLNSPVGTRPAGFDFFRADGTSLT
jgi:coenzyme PQQ precursor peptide PqqA